jgi:hypothetical protein
LAVSVSETAVSATVLQAERDQHEAGDRGQLELDQDDLDIAPLIPPSS